MQLTRSWITVLAFSASLCAARAQDAEPSFTGADSVLTFSDSLAIFQMIDSLMTMDLDGGSQLAFRLSYNSNVLAAGRTLGIEQFGLAPGISYYHKSGVYADVSTYWSRDFDPNLYLTTATVGYIHLFSNKFSAIASYDHYFYNYGDEEDYYIPYSNAVTVSPFLELKPISVRLDYSFYFGDAYANRIMPGISFNVVKKNFLGTERISLYPSVYVLFGDELLTTIELVRPPNLVQALINIKNYGTPFSIEITEKKVFGLMNYAFSAPLNISLKNWLFNLTYTYSIPKAIDDEPLTISNSGFISASIVYYLRLTGSKSSL